MKSKKAVRNILVIERIVVFAAVAIALALPLVVAAARQPDPDRDQSEPRDLSPRGFPNDSEYADTARPTPASPDAPTSTDDRPPEIPVEPPVVSSAHDRIAGATSGIIGGVHDFSRLSGRFADACSACHVPHVQAVRPIARLRRPEPLPDTSPTGRAGLSRAMPGGGAGLDPPSPAGPGVLELYRIEGQRQVFQPGKYMPGPTSLICLSCHNGTVATSTMSTGHALLSGERFGLDLSDDFTFRDHPIGVPYPNDPREYHPQSFVEKKGIPLPDGRLECISCHDPHDQQRIDAMLVMSNRRSALCLTCHKK